MEIQHTISSSHLTNARIHQGDVINHYSNSLDDERACLAHLRATNPPDDKKRIIETKGGLLQKCCRWVLDHDDFVKWRHCLRNPLFWIKGDPGKGKTMLLCGIIDDIESENSSSGSGLLAYFFCEDADERTNSAVAVLRGLIYMLVCQKKSLLIHVQEEYKYAGRKLFEDVNAWIKLSEMLMNILQDTVAEDVTLIVDALDECSTNHDHLLNFIIKSSALGVRWIVSSRNWKRIGAFEAVDKTTLSLELNEAFISDAVKNYIDYKVDELSENKGYDEMTKMAVRAHLWFNSSSTFLWVSIVCRELGSSGITGKHDTLALLNDYFPRGLTALYDRMINFIDTLSQPEIRIQILAICSVVYRPLTLHELRSLLEPQQNFSIDIKHLEELVQTCGSFFSVRGGTIYFIHHSAREYLVKHASHPLLPASIQHRHHCVFSRSLFALQGNLRRNIYQITSPGRLVKDIVTPDPDPLAPIRYSCAHWVDHLCASGLELLFKNQNHGLFVRFLKERLLQWLEALGLMRAIPVAGHAVQALDAIFERHMETSPTPSLSFEGTIDTYALVKDIHRFILYNKSIIELAPLQVYTSAIVFAPSCSIVKDLFREEGLVCNAAENTVKKEWSYCLQTLEGHEDTVVSLVFSPDENLLASASCDGIIKIWDATGTNIQTIHSKRGDSLPVAFSPDGLYLASGSNDRAITIWQVAIGHAFQTICTGDHSPGLVRYVKGSCFILSGLENGTVKVWDLSDGICIQTCEALLGTRATIAASADGRRFARMYARTIEIFDFDPNSLFVLSAIVHDDAHNVLQSPVKFAMNNYQLVYQPSMFGLIRILDPISGSYKELHLPRGTDVYSIAFADDSDWFVAGCSSGAVLYGRTSIGYGTVQGHAGYVTSVALSSNGSRLASASSDKLIRIWSIPRDPRIWDQTRAPAKLLNLIAESHIVATESDQQVKIHDIHTGRLLKVHESSYAPFPRTLMSRDNRVVVAITFDGFQIRNSQNGHCLGTFVVNDWSSSSLLHLSNNNRWLASVNGKYIRIWDVDSKSFFREIYSRDLYTKSIAFSTNGELLASGSYQGTIQIWDLALGSRIYGPFDVRNGTARGVWSMGFSADMKLLAYALMDFEAQTYGINILDLKMGAVTGNVCTVISPITFLSFSRENSRLHTNIGTMLIDSSVADTEDTSANTDASSAALQNRRLKYDGYGLSPDGEWIMKGCENWLWLPPDYRSKETAISDFAVAITCLSGEVFIMNLP